MSKSSHSGKAFEYTIAIKLLEKIKQKKGEVRIEQNESYHSTRDAYDEFSTPSQIEYLNAAEKAIEHIFQLEPHLYNLKPHNQFSITIQNDQRGGEGDPRDVIVLGCNDWKIGFSIKNNNVMSIKSPRLSPTTDLGKKWIGFPSSSEYRESIRNKFDEILSLRSSSIQNWRDLPPETKNTFYSSISDIFVKEICYLVNHTSDASKLLCEYLIGKMDFYMIYKFDDRVEIEAYNLYSTLNVPFNEIKPIIKVKKIKFPTRIIEIKKIQDNIVHVIFDEGWSLSFRVHNGSSKITESIKIEVNYIGKPSLYSHTIPLPMDS